MEKEKKRKKKRRNESSMMESIFETRTADSVAHRAFYCGIRE